MIPIMYDKNTTEFNNNGIGFLSDIISCETTEERNGVYETTFVYPVTGVLYEHITEGNIIKCKVNDTSDLQLFRIYKHSKPMNGVVTYNCEHISYDANGIPTDGLTVNSVSAQTAMSEALFNTYLDNNFECWSDITNANSTDIKIPCSLRNLLGGQKGSILDVWGGEYEFDNYTIKLHKNRGKDTGVIIDYGKNLTDVKQERNIADCYTCIMPYVDQEEIKTLSEKVLPITYFDKGDNKTFAENIGHEKCLIVDLSGEFSEGENVTRKNLLAKTNQYIKANDLGKPKVNITVSFVNLWQTEEYKNIALLERVNLCDIVTVRFTKLGVNAKAKVIKTVYDGLKEKYKSIELGDAKSNFSNTVNKQNQAINQLSTAVKESNSNLLKAIKNATNAITGNSGGYVVLHPAENPQEILVMDSPEIEKAVKLWRFNQAGLGYSSNGYNGDFGLAITMDGRIVADFITTGTMTANRIKGGTLTLGGKSNGSGILKVLDENNNSILTANKDLIAISGNHFTVHSDNLTIEKDGSVSADNVKLTGSITSGGDDYSTTIDLGEFIQHMDQYDIGSIVPVASDGNNYFAISAHSYAYGISLGTMSGTGHKAYYQLNTQRGYNQDNCRHHFYDKMLIENFDIENDVTLSNNLGFKSGCGIVFSDKVAFRIYGGGIYCGADTLPLHLVGSRVFVDQRLVLSNGDMYYRCDDGNAARSNRMLSATWEGGNDAYIAVGNKQDGLFLDGKGVYLKDGTAVTSDERKKHDITDLEDKYINLIKDLKPVSFKYNENSSDRKHTGFIAQQLLKAMQNNNIDTSEFAGFVDIKNDGQDYAIRYEELIAPLLAYTQSLEKRIERLEKKSLRRENKCK